MSSIGLTLWVLCRFFATQNPAGQYVNRHVLPTILRSRFLEVQVCGFCEADIAELVAVRQDPLSGPVATLDALQIARVYQQLQQSNIPCTLREVIKWVRRVHLVHNGQQQVASWPTVGMSLFAPRTLPESAEAKQLQKAFQQTSWSTADISSEQAVSVTDTPEGVQFAEGQLSVVVPGAQLNRSFLFRDQHQPPKSFVRSLVRLAFAVQNHEPVLLVGPTSYKTLLVSTWAALQGRSEEVVKVHLTSDTESTELVGQIQPYSLTDLMVSIPKAAAQLLTRLVNVGADSSNLSIDDLVVQQQPILAQMVAKLQQDMHALVQAHSSNTAAKASSGLSLLSQASSLGGRRQVCWHSNVLALHCAH